MKRIPRLPLLIAALFCVTTWLPAAPAQAQSIELSGGLGYTAVDIDAWAAGGVLQDWNQFMSQVYVQVHLLAIGPLTLGVEAGYQYFLYDVVRVPYGDYPITYTRDTAATRVLATGRISLAGGFFADLGAGPYFISGGPNWGVSAAIGRHIALSSKFSIPVKLRTSIVLDDTSHLLPLGLSAGLAYRM